MQLSPIALSFLLTSKTSSTRSPKVVILALIIVIFISTKTSAILASNPGRSGAITLSIEKVSLSISDTSVFSLKCLRARDVLLPEPKLCSPGELKYFNILVLIRSVRKGLLPTGAPFRSKTVNVSRTAWLLELTIFASTTFSARASSAETIDANTCGAFFV